MKYWKVVNDERAFFKRGSKRGLLYYPVVGELFTDKEIMRKFSNVFRCQVDMLFVSSRDTFKSFGCRFEKSK